MKQLSKIMLAAVASVAIAAPALAWDFSASGSSSAKWMSRTTNTGAEGAKDVNPVAFSSSSGGVTVSSSNSDGANTATFSYTADWNGDDKNFDEYVKVAGSKKVGNWTASSSTSQYMTKDATAATGSQAQTSGGTAVITLTDGSITYKLGDASHLSTAEKAVNGPMDGAVDAEARVDSFNGFSVGLGVGPGTLTVALDMNNGGTVFGDKPAAIACGGGTTGYGLNFAGDVGADLSFTFGTGSTAPSAAGCTGDNASNAASATVMGLGVGIPMGDITIGLDYESTAWNNTAASTETKNVQSGFEISVTMGGIADGTAGINISSNASSVTVGTGDAAETTSAGTELWWTVPIGPVSLAVGYGSDSITTGSDTKVTALDTQIGAEMSMSF
jgi:hypothetical protein